MFLRNFLVFFLIFAGAVQTVQAADAVATPGPDGFAQPYDYERKAYGYDPAGQKADPGEDFQIIFITSAPFTALVSYGLTGLVSLATRDTFSVEGDYLIPFIAGTVAGSATIASVSVLTNKYPPPVVGTGSQDRLVFSLPLAEARF